MSILLNKNTNILVQGITGSEGSFHAEQMMEYGSKVVCGVTPGKGGHTATINKLPVFNSIDEAKKEFQIDATVIFVPPRFAAKAIIEAIKARVELIVCISEGIPARDMVTVKNMLDKSSSTLNRAKLSWINNSRGIKNWYYTRIYMQKRICGYTVKIWNIDL